MHIHITHTQNQHDSTDKTPSPMPLQIEDTFSTSEMSSNHHQTMRIGNE